MSVRSCCYKDCENVSIGHVSNGTFTLFQFPKDPVRRRQWLELGQVDPSLQSGTMLMCSDHFDHSKFLSVNPRRTVLVGAAVPFAYGNQVEEIANEEAIDAVGIHQVLEIEDEGSDENAKYLYFDNGEVQQDDEDEEEGFQVESTIDDDDGKDGNILTYKELMASVKDNSMDDDHELDNDFDADTHDKNIHTSANQVLTIGSSNKYDESIHDITLQCFTNKKRKAVEEVTKTNAKETKYSPSKLQKSIAKTSVEKHKKNTSILQGEKMKATSTLGCIVSDNDHTLPDGNNASNDEIDESSIIDSQNVNLFIFKGEEYVQMSKEYFIKDKLSLLRKIKQYEKALKNIQHTVNLFDFNEHV